ncbi:hypothetical protein [Devosia sp.]|uniref:hypothetical protein n=1 Tax=Devosia sp. TaxID=1871048 RepID=UPI002FCABD3E
MSIAVIMTLGLLLLIAVRGLGHFWPADLLQTRYVVPGQGAQVLIGEVVQAEEVPRARLKGAGLPVPDAGPEFMTRELLKVGNREVYGSDFTWVVGDWLTEQSKPAELMTLERREWGNFYGYLLSVKEKGQVVAEGEAAWPALQERLARVSQLADELARLEKKDIGAINHGLERLRLDTRKLELQGQLDAQAQADLAAERAQLDARYKELEGRLVSLHEEFNRDSLMVREANGQELEISLGKVVHAYQPNAMGLFSKIGFYFGKLWEFLSDDPREANTEGGIFPAIFGTVMMTLIMAVMVTPFGVLAAVYLREYAKQGPLTRTIRIAVNNLAGVPAIVYGVFGLGFFVYVLGGSLDRLFFPEALPAPTFGTPGLLWASLTLAILAVPVVIVATEEGLARIPRAVREGSLALGATKAETLWKVLTGGESVVVAEWPVLSGEAVDAQAATRIEDTQKLITEVRRFRNDQGLKPSQKVPARASGLSEAGMDGQFAYVAALAKLTEPEEGFTASISVEVRLSQGTVTVDIDTSGTIDLGAEKKRLEKDLAAAQKELVTADNKLANEAFLAKAPDAVVDKIKTRRQIAVEEIERITGRLKELADK